MRNLKKKKLPTDHSIELIEEGEWERKAAGRC
jgi:hypothetical protein